MSIFLSELTREMKLTVQPLHHKCFISNKFPRIALENSHSYILRDLKNLLRRVYGQ